MLDADNFICGDRFKICIDWDGDIIREAHFYGFGCAVSKASTSILVELIEGKSKEEAMKISDQFIRVLKNELKPNEALFSEDFKSFSVVKEVPARYDCAALAWEELSKYLDR